jgi:hypothetical protein
MFSNKDSIKPFGLKQSSAFDGRPFRENHWSGIKLTTEEMMYVKYKYHDLQRHNLDKFITAYKSELQRVAYMDRPDWDLHMIDEERYLTPYILIYKTGLAFFWLVTYNLGEFNSSYHKREKNVTKCISGGYTTGTANVAARNFIINFQYYGKNVTAASASK